MIPYESFTETTPSSSSTSRSIPSTQKTIHENANTIENRNAQLASIIQTKITAILATQPNSKYLINLRKVKKLILEHPTPIVSRSELISEIKGMGPKTAQLFDDYFDQNPPIPSPTTLAPLQINRIPSEPYPSSCSNKSSKNSARSIHRFSSTSASSSFDSLSLPAYLSVPYAILICLLEFCKGMDITDALISRNGLLKLMKKYILNTVVVDHGNKWKSHSKLLLHHQWIKEWSLGNRTYYSLTVKGREIALHLKEKYPSCPQDNALDQESQDTEENDFLDVAELSQERPDLFLQKPTFYLTKPINRSLKIILDTREQFSNDRAYFQKELALAGLQVSTRALSVGDMVWVTHEEEVVNVIVERKRLDDLLRSVQETRFQEQIWRLKQSDAQVYYVLEKPPQFFPTLAEQSTLSSSLAQLCFHGFHVQKTESNSETVLFLKMLTDMLIQKSLPCEPYTDFHQRTLKHAHVPLQAVYTRMLQTIKGMSLEKVQALVRTYPTLRHLHDASDLDPYFQQQNESLGRKRIGPKLAEFIKTFLKAYTYPN